MQQPNNDIQIQGNVYIDAQPGFFFTSDIDRNTLSMHFVGSTSTFIINALIQELKAVRDGLGYEGPTE